MTVIQSLTELRQGVVIEQDGQPWQVVASDFMRKAQRKPVMRTKLRNLIDGRVMEQSFKPGDRIETADLGRSKATFLYEDAGQCTFMDATTFDQFSFTAEQIGDQRRYLKPDQEVDVMLFNDRPATIDLPKKIELKVTQTNDASRGDTAQGSVTKEAELETGYIVKVPLFVKTGDTIRVNTETGDYVDRV